MQNWYTVEVEAASRRSDWERQVAAEVRAAQALGEAPSRWPRLSRQSLAWLQRVASPRLGIVAFGRPRRGAPACTS